MESLHQAPSRDTEINTLFELTVEQQQFYNAATEAIDAGHFNHGVLKVYRQEKLLPLEIMDEITDAYITRLEQDRDIEPMTGLLNRHGLERRFLPWLNRFIHIKRGTETIGTQRLVFFAVDINKMKDINDRYGHIAGDAALKAVSEAIKQTFRNDDVMSLYNKEDAEQSAETDNIGARTGGDEFLIILEIDTTKADLIEITKRLRKNISSLTIKIDDKDFQFSASVGCQSYTPDQARNLLPPKETVNAEEVAEVIGRLAHPADQAMYEAKNGQTSNETAVQTNN